MKASALMLVLAVTGLGLVPQTVVAQRPGMPGGQPGTMPPPTAAPVIPDTVEIVIAVPDSLPQPVAVHVVQDTLVFGGLLNLVLDFPADQKVGPELQPQAEGDWLVPYTAPKQGVWARLLGHGNEPAVDLTALGPTTWQRVVRSFRVYRRDPLRIRWGDELSDVLIVVGQTQGTDQIAGIRDPRTLRWTPWRIVVALVILIVLAILLRWWWLRRHAPAPLSQWPVMVPPWLALATGLQELVTDNTLARGDSRLYLDRLAALARAYVADRYRVAAREMTGREIMRACAALGHDQAHPAGFGNLIDLADRERYDLTPPEAAFCREQAVQLLGRVSRVRLGTQYSSISAEQVLAAEKAWSALTVELGLGAGRPTAATIPEVR